MPHGCSFRCMRPHRNRKEGVAPDIRSPNECSCHMQHETTFWHLVHLATSLSQHFEFCFFFK